MSRYDDQADSSYLEVRAMPAHVSVYGSMGEQAPDENCFVLLRPEEARAMGLELIAFADKADEQKPIEAGDWVQRVNTLGPTPRVEVLYIHEDGDHFYGRAFNGAGPSGNIGLAGSTWRRVPNPHGTGD